jgi:hypothetical protein
MALSFIIGKTKTTEELAREQERTLTRAQRRLTRESMAKEREYSEMNKRAKALLKAGKKDEARKLARKMARNYQATNNLERRNEAMQEHKDEISDIKYERITNVALVGTARMYKQVSAPIRGMTASDAFVEVAAARNEARRNREVMDDLKRDLQDEDEEEDALQKAEDDIYEDILKDLEKDLPDVLKFVQPAPAASVKVQPEQDIRVPLSAAADDTNVMPSSASKIVAKHQSPQVAPTVDPAPPPDISLESLQARLDALQRR